MIYVCTCRLLFALANQTDTQCAADKQLNAATTAVSTKLYNETADKST
jgi:hypothetical protein